MDTARRWGVGLTVLAAALWTLIVIATVTTGPEDGANIGAGMLFMVAVPCTVAGVTLWVGNRRSALQPVGAGPVPAPLPTSVSGNPAASWSLILGIAALVLDVAPLTGSETGIWMQTLATLLIGIMAVGLGWLALRRARRGAANRGLALAGVIAGASSIALNMFLVPELVLFLTGNL